MSLLRLNNYFADYEMYHQNKINLAIHKIAIPCIVFHIIAMLNWIKVLNISGMTITLAEIFICVVAVFYIRLNLFLGTLMIFFMLLCLFAAFYTPVWLVFFIATAAWIIQLIGHYKWEKNSPAFYKNLIQLLIGPIFILAKVTKKY